MIAARHIDGEGDLARRFILDVTADGQVRIRERGTPITDALPAFSVNTYDEAEQIRVRHCRLSRTGSGAYLLTHWPTERDATLDDLAGATALFRESYEALSRDGGQS